MLRGFVRVAGALLDALVTLGVILVVLVLFVLFMLVPSLFIPHRKPSEGFDIHHAH
ncbi:MAG: hypothetical protein KDB90_06830 [Planctomycetes bacterium]|nr:hypothetical protein [Planctomycetota bacterium]